MNAQQQWTVDAIRQAMTASGSHWWDKSAMKFFGTRVLPTVYQGRGGIYFVTSEQPPHGERGFTVRQYRENRNDIKTIGNVADHSRDEAMEIAKSRAAFGDYATETVEPLTGQDAKKQSHTDLIKAMLSECNDSGQHWKIRHGRLFSAHHPLASMILSLARYADDHETRFESSIGEDGFLGPAWESMVRNVLTLLNGELNGLDGGTLDKLLRDMLTNEGFDAS